MSKNHWMIDKQCRPRLVPPHLGLHCLLRTACVNTEGKYSISLLLSTFLHNFQASTRMNYCIKPNKRHGNSMKNRFLINFVGAKEKRRIKYNRTVVLDALRKAHFLQVSKYSTCKAYTYCCIHTVSLCTQSQSTIYVTYHICLVCLGLNGPVNTIKIRSRW